MFAVYFKNDSVASIRELVTVEINDRSGVRTAQYSVEANAFSLIIAGDDVFHSSAQSQMPYGLADRESSDIWMK